MLRGGLFVLCGSTRRGRRGLIVVYLRGEPFFRHGMSSFEIETRALTEALSSWTDSLDEYLRLPVPFLSLKALVFFLSCSMFYYFSRICLLRFFSGKLINGDRDRATG